MCPMASGIIVKPEHHGVGAQPFGPVARTWASGHSMKEVAQMAVLNPTPAVRPGVDRFLIGIFIGVVVLLVLAGASLFFTGQTQQDFPADTPSGTVQRFLLALDKQDYN